MKKLLYIIALTVVVCFSLSSCTEEVIKPKDASSGTIGNPIKE